MAVLEAVVAVFCAVLAVFCAFEIWLLVSSGAAVHSVEEVPFSILIAQKSILYSSPALNIIWKSG